MDVAARLKLGQPVTNAYTEECEYRTVRVPS
jgi:hypothetical protein